MAVIFWIGFFFWEVIKTTITIVLLAIYWHHAQNHHGIPVIVYLFLVLAQSCIEIFADGLMVVFSCSSESGLTWLVITFIGHIPSAIYGLISVITTRHHLHHFKALYVWACIWTGLGMIYLLLFVIAIALLATILIIDRVENPPPKTYRSRTQAEEVLQRQRAYYMRYYTQICAPYAELPPSLLKHPTCACCLRSLLEENEASSMLSMTAMAKLAGDYESSMSVSAATHNSTQHSSHGHDDSDDDDGHNNDTQNQQNQTNAKEENEEDDEKQNEEGIEEETTIAKIGQSKNDEDEDHTTTQVHHDEDIRVNSTLHNDAVVIEMNNETKEDAEQIPSAEQQNDQSEDISSETSHGDASEPTERSNSSHAAVPSTQRQVSETSLMRNDAHRRPSFSVVPNRVESRSRGSHFDKLDLIKTQPQHKEYWDLIQKKNAPENYIVVLHCQHTFHLGCVFTVLLPAFSKCPVCRSPIYLDCEVTSYSPYGIERSNPHRVLFTPIEEVIRDGLPLSINSDDPQLDQNRQFEASPIYHY